MLGKYSREFVNIRSTILPGSIKLCVKTAKSIISHVLRVRKMSEKKSSKKLTTTQRSTTIYNIVEMLKNSTSFIPIR